MIFDILKPYGKMDFICEFGGGGSCFYKAFRDKYPNTTYIAIDSSYQGVKSFNERYCNQSNKQIAILSNLLEHNFIATSKTMQIPQSFDLVFSVGLIEHFNQQQTKIICAKHFKALKSGGIALITYPTPTPLYRLIRGILERLNMWQFYDERPLDFEEVNAVCSKYGELQVRKLNVLIGLTQEVLVYKKY